MDKILTEKLPQWFYNISPEKNYLVLTNDMDSYFSCRIIEKCTGVKIGGFYSFDKGLYLDTEYAKDREPIFVDLSVSRGKTFDNHYTFIENEEAINPNLIKKPYFKKFNGGTLALVAALFDDYSSYSEYQWETLLAVDSFYYGYYNKGGAFKDVNVFWFNILGIADYVIPILERKTADDFSKFIEKEGLKEEIRVNDNGELVCRKHIVLPKGKFKLVRPIEKRFMPKWEAVICYQKQKDKIIVSNEIYSGKYVLNFKSDISVGNNNRNTLRPLSA